MDEKKEEEKKLSLENIPIDEYITDIRLIKYIQKNFKRLSRVSTLKLINYIIVEDRIDIPIKWVVKRSKGFKQYNMSKIDNDKFIPEEIINIKKTIIKMINDIHFSSMEDYNEENDNEIKLKKGEEDGCYIINKKINYYTLRKYICDEGGNISFKYRFIEPDLKIKTPENEDTLQRCFIQILSMPVKFDYPLEYSYRCDVCGHRERKKTYEVASTKTKTKCVGIYHYETSSGEQRTRACRDVLYPDEEMTLTKDAYYYEIGYEDEEGNKHAASVMSFNKYEPGYYDSVLFKIKNPKKTELFNVIDVQEINNNDLIIPDKVEGENYIFTLQKTFDEYIKNQTGQEIYGLFPIKVALIMQTFLSHIKEKLIFNLQVVGDPSTGKSLILKYYSFLLNSHFNLSTNGLSVSIPALRGTKQTINLMGREQKIISVGYLGTFKSIHIDEAGENRELVQNLKTFLLEQNYGYDKAGATGVFNKRIAHINISENLDYNYLGQYRGSIRKAYKDSNNKMENIEKEKWEEKWDLHLPNYKYDNPYLRLAIMEKRQEYANSQIWWIDGHELALHERFPFYFYLVTEKENDDLLKVIKRNKSHKTIEENLELIKVLKNEDINNLYKTLSTYYESEHDEESYDVVDDILKKYNVYADVRMRTFYYMILKVSRMMNKRIKANEEDYDLLRWFLEKMNIKLDVIDTVDYNIEGPPDYEEVEKQNLEIEEKMKEVDEEFGLQDGEFK